MGEPSDEDRKRARVLAYNEGHGDGCNWHFGLRCNCGGCVEAIATLIATLTRPAPPVPKE